jgi:hypothetical protein
MTVTRAQPTTKYGVNCAASRASRAATDAQGSAQVQQTMPAIVSPGDFSIDAVGPGLNGSDADLHNAGPFNAG